MALSFSVFLFFSFTIHFISQKILPSRYIPVVANGRILSFLNTRVVFYIYYLFTFIINVNII